MPFKLNIIHYVSECKQQVTYSFTEKENIPDAKNYATTKMKQIRINILLRQEYGIRHTHVFRDTE